MFSGRTTTTVSAPAPGPMDLNEAGRPQWRDLAPLFALALLGVVVAIVGGVIFIATRPAYMEDWGWWNTLGMTGGGALAYFGMSWAWNLRGNITYGITRYYDRIDLWDELMRQKYAEGNGKIVAQQVSEWTYNPLDLRSLLLAYMAILVSQPSSLTVDKLEREGLWLKLEAREIRIITFTQDSAAQFLNLLAEGKVIEGRGPRQAGRVLVDQPANQARRLLKLALRNPQALAAIESQQEV